MRTHLGYEVNEVDDWKRYQCIKMPISEIDSNACITPDGDIVRCIKCRYHIRNYLRRVN